MRKKEFNLVHFLDKNRALFMLIFAGVFFTVHPGARNFLTEYNIRTILTGSSLSGICAVGFTLIFILGQIDLSIGSVLMLSGMLTVGLQPALGWALSTTIAVLSGVAVGFVNGILVSKVKINSFIVTLGSMIIVRGLMHWYCDGGAKSVDDYDIADWLEMPLLGILTPMTLITIGIMLLFAFILTSTRYGRGFFIVGGNAETAWLAGLNKDRYLIAGFIICDGLAAVGGAIFAMKLASSTAYAILGTKTLMQVIAAIIIGGTLMTGGRGSIVKSFIAVLFLVTVNNGFGCFGFGFEVQIFVNGLILALVVLYEAYTLYRRDLLRGQRPYLLEELENMKQ